ncbi:hypothetical protein C5D60_07005 [Rathayibacter toxicus]|uniref:Uncharacterized protein n=1 Tax=Rathayibacter toxicus TaxID=145458 RepID=A0A2S5Y5Q4_9MICO|nr:hypothetical protein APU90_09955 [Rathayibacter toxicus]PPG20267.1 hypothetical protein C5D15_06950 [Rathayibacter toxicus]PPG45366.1 hypothetical protein C5D16_06910 [Rathayibacter toxicus]PPH22468.1 hypothetical protein C5D17_06950 [Rathayibacter toxicus]PPH59362.1 hypothetical protein C5C93_06980 [Rathayibacter toxicus]
MRDSLFWPEDFVKIFFYTPTYTFFYYFIEYFCWNGTTPALQVADYGLQANLILAMFYKFFCERDCFRGYSSFEVGNKLQQLCVVGVYGVVIHFFPFF